MKNILLKSLGAILFFFSGHTITIQAQTTQKLYYSFSVGSQTETYFKNNDVKMVISMDNRYYAPKGSINFNLFAKSINKFFPSSASKGIGVLDWEGKYLQSLWSAKPQSNDFRNALNLYIQLVKYAKKMRPNVQWGFYGIPFTTYWNRNEKWQQSNLNILPLLSECDILFPTFYVFYKEGSQDKAGNIGFAHDNMTECLKLADMVNKPVLPFIWNRYHDSNKKIGLQLIPINDFTTYIRAILNTSYKGKKANGMVWWGADNYYYRVKSKVLVNEYQSSRQNSFSNYDDLLHIQYCKALLKTLQ